MVSTCSLLLLLCTRSQPWGPGLSFCICCACLQRYLQEVNSDKKQHLKEEVGVPVLHSMAVNFKQTLQRSLSPDAGECIQITSDYHFSWSAQQCRQSKSWREKRDSIGKDSKLKQSKPSYPEILNQILGFLILGMTWQWNVNLHSYAKISLSSSATERNYLSNMQPRPQWHKDPSVCLWEPGGHFSNHCG